MKKGTFAGVIPMMGLFVMAAVMGFQSIPIGQAVSQELTDSFSDLSRVSETKSYADLYFFNFVPTGASHSVNEITYTQGQIGGNVTWNYKKYKKNDATDRMIDNVTKGQLQPKVIDYFNKVYGGESRRGECTIPELNYTGKILPSPTDSILRKEHVDYYEKNLPVLLRSEVPDTGEAAPIQAECSSSKGNTRYIGDTRDSTTVEEEDEENEDDQNNNDENNDNNDENNIDLDFTDQNNNQQSSNLFVPTYNPVDLIPWGGDNNNDDSGGIFTLNKIEPVVFDDFTSVGYTKELNVTGNRYHILTGETAKFFNLLFGEWQSVDDGYGESPWTCSLGYNDYQTAVSKAENVVSGDISEGKSEAEASLEQDLPDGIEIKKSVITTSDELAYDVTASNFNGRANTGTNSRPCECSCGKKCCYPKRQATATVYAENSRINFTLIDDKYKVLTEDEWRNLEFNVNTYKQDYEKD